jgi:O-succinylbenzoic acid--CoA ligase
MLPLKQIAANDTFGVLNALIEVLDGKLALFVKPAVVGDALPKTYDLPDEVADDVALIVESSGTTGVPKQIKLSREALLASANASAKHLGASGQWLLALPANYIAGTNVLIRSIVAGTQPVLMNTTLPFSAEAFVRASLLLTHEHKFTSLVPTQLFRLAEAARAEPSVLFALKQFTAILVGGQAADPALVARLREQGVNLVLTYGSTETAGGCVYDGLPLDGVRVALLPDGRISLDGPVLANDLSRPFVTNDLGEFDEAGRLHVLGRADRVLVSGGLKVSLDQLEHAALTVPGVTQATALAVDDAQWGQRAALFYVGSPEVADYLAGEVLVLLGAAAKPVRVLRVGSMPRLATGKVDYLALKTLL